jgi:hypothetical protein
MRDKWTHGARVVADHPRLRLFSRPYPPLLRSITISVIISLVIHDGISDGEISENFSKLDQSKGIEVFDA